MTTSYIRVSAEASDELTTLARIWQIILVVATVTASGLIFVSQYRYMHAGFTDDQWPYRNRHEPDIILDLWVPVIVRSVVVLAVLAMTIAVIAGLIALSLRYVSPGPLWVFEWTAEVLVVVLAICLVLNEHTTVFHFLL
jgi:hypothetical protein